MALPIVAVLMDTANAGRIMTPELWSELESFAELRRNPHPRPPTFEEAMALLRDAEAALCTWGSPRFTQELLGQAPRLKMIAYAGGSVKPIVSEAVWERGIRVTSAAAGIAVDVAETTVALMVISVKKIWQYHRWTRSGGWGTNAPWGPPEEMNGKTVGIIAASHVGRNVIRLLKAYDVHLLLYDPYVTEEQAQEMGVEKVSLEDLLRRSDIVTCHAPATEETYHLLNAERLRLLKDGAIFINTSRGSLVDERALIQELMTGRIFACIDVTDPEPPSPDSFLRKLDNVILTPHISGCITNRTRLGKLVVEELRRFFAGEPPLYPVTREMLSRIG